jgi:hypothetical protein
LYTVGADGFWTGEEKIQNKHDIEGLSGGLLIGHSWLFVGVFLMLKFLIWSL